MAATIDTADRASNGLNRQDRVLANDTSAPLMMSLVGVGATVSCAVRADIEPALFALAAGAGAIVPVNVNGPFA